MVAEGNNLLLGNKESKLVQTLLRELGDLDTLYDSTEVWRDVLDRNAILEQVGLLWVCTEARIGEF